jgi:hypothetical protein
MSDARRISLGFHGGQVLALRIAEKPLADLYGALGGEGWYEIATEDGPVRIDLRQLVYVSADTDELRVGFG